ncbi:helix-turn-helix domain-containing protein [Limnoglobus roseus]|uniref:Uncharacterized protein n=1 Tax=Limnoglobus roseus TaxID=2598579 RepID=A0A5C1AJM7_9BACT|nr:helix-turn-helix transcriptional regulator [Limnoglobus roseus]QEL19070.1 hypothetical protein PX52LOC_06127 [Limnoglobus roseus]
MQPIDVLAGVIEDSQLRVADLTELLRRAAAQVEAARPRKTEGKKEPKTWESFRSWLREKMDLLQLSERDLAKRTDLSTGSINGYLNPAGKFRSPSLVNALRILIAVDGSLDELIRIRDVLEEVGPFSITSKWAKRAIS